MLKGNTQDFRCHQRHRGAGAANIRAARQNRNVTVCNHIERGARLHTGVNPVAHGDPAAGTSGNRRLVVRVVARHFKTLPQTDAVIGCAHHVGVALFHCVEQSELNRVHPQLGGKLGDREFEPQRDLRNTWRAIRMNFRFVGVYRAAGGARIGELVAGRRHKGRDPRRIAVIGPRVHQALNIRRHQLTVSGRAEFYPGLRTGCRTGGTEHITAVHDHLHRAA